MQLKYQILGLLTVLVLSTSGADDYSGDWSGEDYAEYDDELTVQPDHSGDGGDETVEITPRIMHEAGITIIDDHLNDTATNDTLDVTTNLLQLEPLLAPVLTTDKYPEIDLPKCPKECQCTDGTLFINCSRRALNEIPNELPNDALVIDLSQNNIKQLNITAFANCTSLRDLLVNENQIESITGEETFASLSHLTYIDLTSNLLQNLTGNEFNAAKQLTKLILNDNPLELEEGKSLVNLSSLEILDLVGCNITELYNTTFEPLTGLLSLNLNKNPLNEKINVNAFRSLKNLRELHIPKIDQAISLDLCHALNSIDGINVGTFQVSCFELVSGNSFEDSTATLIPLTTSEKIKVPESTASIWGIDGIGGNPTTPKENIRTTSETLSTTTKKINDTSPVPTDGISSTTPVLQSGVIAAPGNKSNRIDISARLINNILIGIIATALIGLTIGIICRQDCFGIKTKLCRTRRPAATDQVRPAEEVPLNKV